MLEPSFRHILLTRFNTRRDAFAVPPDDSWLRNRWALFEQFCVPSVSRQLCKDFEWLVFFDAGTPALWRTRVDGTAAMAGFRPVYLDEPFGAAAAARAIAALRVESAPFLITSRLDNDDALAPHFVATVQRAFRPRRLEFLNLPLGYQLSGGRLFLRPYLASSFASLVEAVGEGPIHTVHFTEHHLIGRHPVRQLWSRPAWLQVIHGRNIANEIRGIPIAGEAAVARFGLTDVDTTPPRLSSRLAATARFGVRALNSPGTRSRVASVLRTRTSSAR